jgi:hypothetical protein
MTLDPFVDRPVDAALEFIRAGCVLVAKAIEVHQRSNPVKVPEVIGHVMSQSPHCDIAIDRKRLSLDSLFTKVNGQRILDEFQLSWSLYGYCQANHG